MASQKDPSPGEGGSGRPGPSPEAREALTCGPVGLDGRLSPRRPPAAGSSPLSTGIEGGTCGSVGVCATAAALWRVQHWVAGRCCGEKNNVRACVFTETLVLAKGGVDSGFRIQPHPSSLCQQGDTASTEREGGGLGGVWAPLGGWQTSALLLGSVSSVCQSLSGDGSQAVRSVVMPRRGPVCVPPPAVPRGSCQRHPSPLGVLAAHVSSCGYLHFILSTQCFL